MGVLPFRWPKFFEQFPLMAGHAAFAGLAARHVKKGSGDGGGAGGASDIVQRVAAASGEEQLELLTAYVRDTLVKVLGFDASQAIDPQKGFFAMGGDSLSSVELRNRLQQGLGKKLPTTMIFDYPTIAAITGYLASEVLADVMKADVPASDSAEVSREEMEAAEAERVRDEIATEVDGMSEDEAEAALLAELAALD